MRNKEKTRSRILYIISAVFFLFGISLFVVNRILKIDSVALWYSKYTGVLMEFEQRVESVGDSWLILFAIEANFFLKAVIPWVPISCICVMSGVVFKWPVALSINIIGLIILYAVRYLLGKQVGGGNAEKILAKYDKAYTYIDTDKFSGRMFLLIFRLVPCLPLNAVSQLYGSLEFNFWDYMLISLIGSAYKLFSYTIIGRNVYDPLSGRFLIPLGFLFVISGIALILINSALNVTEASIKTFKKIKIKIKNKNGGA